MRLYISIACIPWRIDSSIDKYLSASFYPCSAENFQDRLEYKINLNTPGKLSNCQCCPFDRLVCFLQYSTL